MAKKSKRNMLLPGMAVAGVAATLAAASAVAGYFVRAAIDRELPKAISKVQKYIFPVKKTEGVVSVADVSAALGDASYRLRNSPLEEVSIIAHDGVRLVGHWMEGEDPERVIIAVHGWRSTWDNDFGLVADFWKENGCSVLFVEQRGQNNSGGDCMSFGLLERYDCRDWALWADKRTEGRMPIYFDGISMGATSVLMATALDLPKSVKGVIADCGFTSPDAILDHVMSESLHLPYGVHRSEIRRRFEKRFGSADINYSAEEALLLNRLPVLFVHGTDDTFVPIEMTYKNYKACTAPKRLLVVPGAEHGMSYVVDKDGCEAAMRAFWRDFDRAIEA